MAVHYHIKEIAEAAHARLYGNYDLPVSYLSTDSRTLPPSPETLFIAINGPRHDGHQFIADLYQRGVRCFLVSTLPELSAFPDAAFCLVDDPVEALQDLAAWNRSQYRGELIGITGSNGKTIVKEWLFQCLRQEHHIARSPKSYNSQIGVPLSAWLIDAQTDLAIIEAGISLPGEMARLEKIIRPVTGIFTNLGAAHQEHFVSATEKMREKVRLFSGCRRVIYRSDRLVEGKRYGEFMKDLAAEKISWAFDGSGYYSFRHCGSEAGSQTVEWSGPGLGSPVRIRIPFSDEAALENACHVMVYLLLSGMDPAVIAERVAALEPVAMRLEILQGVMGSVLVNDVYNADLVGLTQALDVLATQQAVGGRMVILSDLLQTGIDKEELYREIAHQLKMRKVDRFAGVGPDLLRFRELFPEGSHFYSDTPDFLKRFPVSEVRGRAVLIKGSRPFAFERITGELQKKSHQTVLEIDLNAMAGNLNYFRSLLRKDTGIIVVVKALSYGTGSVEIASLLQYHKVSYLAVAFVDEGVALREAGIYLPVMVLNPDPSTYQAMMDYRLEPEIYSFRGLEQMANLCRYRGENSYPVHIKMDTGMHRLGFDPGETDRIAEVINGSGLKVKTVFSHLAASEDPVHDAFTAEQIRRFEAASEQLRRKLGYSLKRHILNSAGIERFPEAQFELVRLGIGLHGISTVSRLQPVSTYRTVVSQVHDLEAGETVGYSRAGVMKRKGTVAIIPVGYADGIDRRLGNGKGEMLVAGQRAKVIGNVCMDMTLLDVTGLTVREGDEVEIFGKSLPVTEVAEKLSTIPYEVLTSIPERVKRIYIQE
ncbi:MAG: bifunctional UDP-N-acetylmuramoyl-tripeptide:D-alanyl-D-alanine ligase/alanine racemase [Bacteroidota bacterium]